MSADNVQSTREAVLDVRSDVEALAEVVDRLEVLLVEGSDEHTLHSYSGEERRRINNILADLDAIAGHLAGDEQPKFSIRIDREFHRVAQAVMTGAEIRTIPTTPIPADHDLFHFVPGHDHTKIGDGDSVDILDHMRFFTVPRIINSGRSTP